MPSFPRILQRGFTPAVHWLLLGAGIIFVLWWRFVLSDLDLAEALQWRFGYGILNLTFGVWIWALIGMLDTWYSHLRQNWWRWLFIGGCFAVVLAMTGAGEGFIYKVNYDEPGHAATAYCMYAEQVYGIPYAVYYDGGLPGVVKYGSTYRAGLFSYFSSLAHFCFGFSEQNPFLVNIMAAWSSLIAITALGWRVTRSWWQAMLPAVLVLAIPLFTHMAFSAMCDVTNLMLFAIYLLALYEVVLTLNAKTAFFVVATGCLFAQARSESIGFLGLIVPILIFHVKSGRFWPHDWRHFLLLPGLLLSVSVQVILMSSPFFLRQGHIPDGEPVSTWGYFENNFFEAIRYFLSWQSDSGNMAPLFWAALCISIPALAWRLSKRYAWDVPVVLWIATIVAYGAFYCMMLSTFWGGPEVDFMERFTMPLWMLFALTPIIFGKDLRLFRDYSVRILLVAIGFIIVCTRPKLARDNAARENYLGRAEQIVVGEAKASAKLGGAVIVTEYVHACFAARLPAYSPQYLKDHPGRFRTALAYGMFDQLLLILNRRGNTLYFMGKETPKDFEYKILREIPVEFGCSLVFAKLNAVRTGVVLTRFDNVPRARFPDVKNEKEWRAFTYQAVP